MDDISDYTPLLTIVLKKKWSRNPSYWLCLFCQMKTPVRWAGIAKWKWYKKDEGEWQEGSVVAFAREYSYNTATVYLKRRLQEKLGAEYMVHSVDYENMDTLPGNVQKCVRSFGESCYHMKPSLPTPMTTCLKLDPPVSEVQDTSPVANSDCNKQDGDFLELQNKRKKKAKWQW